MSEQQIDKIVEDLKSPEPTVKLNVFQQAVPFQFYAEVPHEILEEAYDKLWAEREPAIPPHVIAKARKGFRTTTPIGELRKRIVTIMGGEAQFYEAALLRIIDEAFRNLEPKPRVEVFSWTTVDIRPQSDGNFAINAIGYFEPEVIWQVPTKPKNFKVTFPADPPDFVENAVNRNLAQLATQHKVDAPSDDLAITMGYETLAQLKGTIQKRIEDKMTSDRENQAFEAIREFLFTQVKISPIPETWRQYKAQEAYQEAMRRFKSEDKFLQAINMGNREDVIRYYSSQMASALAEQLVFRDWARQLPVEGAIGLHDMFTYFSTVRKHVLQNMELDFSDDVNTPVKAEGVY